MEIVSRMTRARTSPQDPVPFSTQVYVAPDTYPFDLVDPVGSPYGPGYWKHQTRVALTGHGEAQVDAETLAAYLPFPLFDQQVGSIAAAGALLEGGGPDPEGRALRQCLATRLDVAAGELGWYGLVDVFGETVYLWEAWADAHDAFLAGDPATAQWICGAANAAEQACPAGRGGTRTLANRGPSLAGPDDGRSTCSVGRSVEPDPSGRAGRVDRRSRDRG